MNTQDQQYWIDRMTPGTLQSVGFRGFSNEANETVYSVLRRAVRSVFCRYGIPHEATILDAGAGIGMIANDLLQNGYRSIVAVDVSADALAHINPSIMTITATLESLDAVLRTQFDVVYCFDVLYHITDEALFQKVVTNLCRSSRDLIFVHGMFPRMIPLHIAKHVRFRRLAAYDAAFKRNGFVRSGFEPTHFFLLRLGWYRFYGMFPHATERIDQALLNMARAIGLASLSSHMIVIYRKQT